MGIVVANVYRKDEQKHPDDEQQSHDAAVNRPYNPIHCGIVLANDRRVAIDNEVLP